MIGGGLAALPNALMEGLPHAPASATPVLALALLAFAGTVGPFALFAYGQSRVTPELAGSFLNLEPLVGTAAGALAFGDPFGPLQLLGSAVILAGIALSTTPREACRAGPGGGRAAAPGAVWLAAPAHARHLPHACEGQSRVCTYQAGPLNTLPQHDPPSPPNRPHHDSPHLCGPGGSRAPLP